MNHDITKQVETLYRQVNEISSIYHSAVSRTGISDNEFWVWYSLIAVEGERTQQSICVAWSLSKQTVNTIVRHMTEQGYAVLEPIPGTRNRKAIRLTEAGEAYGRSIIDPVRRVEKSAFERMDAGDLDACITAQERFIRVMKEELEKAQLGAGRCVKRTPQLCARQDTLS